MALPGPAHPRFDEDDMKIANKTLLITGANRGVGEALVTEALGRGVRKIFAGTRNGLRHPDPRVVPLTLDVTDDLQILQAAQGLGDLDVLVNNAGIALYDDLSSVEALEKQLAVNCFGSLKMARAVLPLLVRSGQGAIVNVLSLAALAPMPIIPAYSISKAAAHSMTQSLRLFLSPQGVTVHAVFLGPVDTEMNRGFDIPKASPGSAAAGILDGLERGDEDIFPDPASRPLAEGFRSSVAKALEREMRAYLSRP
jgi:NAD(P)-dependent dehydrogenase (short-subunit alcohol dehydrogenase family)